MTGNKSRAIIIALAATAIALVLYSLGTRKVGDQPAEIDVGSVTAEDVASPRSAVVPPQPEANREIALAERNVDMNQLVAALESPDEDVRTHAVETLFPQFAVQDPAAARRIVETVTSTPHRARLLQLLGTALARADRADALSWATAIPDRFEREEATAVVLAEISLTDPGQAVRLRQDTIPPADDAVLQDLVQRWAEKDLATTLDWAASLPPGEQRDRVHARIAYVQSQSSPESAASLIVERMSPGQAREEALVSVLHQWARIDSAAARRWIQELPTGALQDRAAAEVDAAAPSR